MVDDRQVLEQLRGRVAGEQPRFIPIEESGGPGLAPSDLGFGRDMDGSLGGPDPDAVGDQHLSESSGRKNGRIRHGKAAPNIGPSLPNFPVYANLRRGFNTVQPEVGTGTARHRLGLVAHVERKSEGDGFNPGREAQAGRRKDLERYDVFIEGERRYGRGEPLVQVPRIPLRSQFGTGKVRRITDHGALDAGDAGFGDLAGEGLEHIGAIPVKPIGNPRISRSVEDQVPSEDPVLDGAVCEDKRLVPERRPKKVEGRGGRGDFHVRRRRQEAILIPCEQRVLLLERDDEDAPLGVP